MFILLLISCYPDTSILIFQKDKISKKYSRYYSSNDLNIEVWGHTIYADVYDNLHLGLTLNIKRDENISKVIFDTKKLNIYFNNRLMKNMNVQDTLLNDKYRAILEFKIKSIDTDFKQISINEPSNAVLKIMFDSSITINDSVIYIEPIYANEQEIERSFRMSRSRGNQ